MVTYNFCRYLSNISLLIAVLVHLITVGQFLSFDDDDTNICSKEPTYSIEKIEDWMTRLATVYNRGFWDGYYLGRKMGEWNDTHGSKASQKKIYLGRGQHFFSKFLNIYIRSHLSFIKPLISCFMYQIPP